jgi:hypothetical protein
MGQAFTSLGEVAPNELTETRQKPVQEAGMQIQPSAHGSPTPQGHGPHSAGLQRYSAAVLSEQPALPVTEHHVVRNYTSYSSANLRGETHQLSFQDPFERSLQTGSVGSSSGAAGPGLFPRTTQFSAQIYSTRETIKVTPQAINRPVQTT